MSCDDFQGTAKIEIQPGTNNIPYGFKIASESSLGAGDGHLPFGATIQSVVVTVFDENENDVTANIVVGSPAIAVDIVQINFKWPGSAGIYGARMVVNIGGTDTEELDFLKIEARDKKNAP